MLGSGLWHVYGSWHGQAEYKWPSHKRMETPRQLEWNKNSIYWNHLTVCYTHRGPRSFLKLWVKWVCCSSALVPSSWQIVANSSTFCPWPTSQLCPSVWHWARYCALPWLYLPAWSEEQQCLSIFGTPQRFVKSNVNVKEKTESYLASFVLG